MSINDEVAVKYTTETENVVAEKNYAIVDNKNQKNNVWVYIIFTKTLFKVERFFCGYMLRFKKGDYDK